MSGARPQGAPPAELARLHPDAHSRPFWHAAGQHRLVVPRCLACGTFRFPPTPFCHVCLHQDVEWAPVPGTGTVYTYTVARHAVVPILADALPYVVAAIELDEAPNIRMVANVVGCDPEAVHIGSRVQVDWDDIDLGDPSDKGPVPASVDELDDHVTIPRFRLIADGSESER